MVRREGSREGGRGVEGGTAVKVGIVWREDSREGGCGVEGGTAVKVGVV